MSMEMGARIDTSANLGAILIRGNGSREDRGIVASDSRPVMFRIQQHIRWLWKKMRREGAIPLSMGLVAFTSWVLKQDPALLIGIVTTAGVNYMASDFASGGVTPTISGFKFHDSGVGTTAAVVGDTDIETTDGEARVAGTPTNPAANQYRSVATIAYTTTKAITEWGLFSASTAGTLWDRRVFAAVNVVNGDSIQFTYTLTVNNGGT